MTLYLILLVAGVLILTLVFTATSRLLAMISERFRLPEQTNLLDTIILRFIPVAGIFMVFSLFWTWYINGDPIFTRTILRVLFLLTAAWLYAEERWIAEAGWVQAVVITLLGGILGGACVFGLIRLFGELGMRLDCL